MTAADKNYRPTEDSEELAKIAASLLSTKTFLKVRNRNKNRIFNNLAIK